MSYKDKGEIVRDILLALLCIVLFILGLISKSEATEHLIK